MTMDSQTWEYLGILLVLWLLGIWTIGYAVYVDRHKEEFFWHYKEPVQLERK